MQLIEPIVHPQLSRLDGNVLRRQAVRGIVLRKEKILLLYSERYNDFCLPGGGLDEGEDLLIGLCRELEEKPGAQDVISE